MQYFIHNNYGGNSILNINKIKSKYCFLLTLLLVSMILIMFSKINVYAYSPAKELPDISGMSYREAFIAVAKSQIGYSEDKNGATIYGEWAGDSKQAWCSEFVAWCAEQAGIPKTIIPKKRSTIGYRSFFKDKNSFYLLENGGYTSSCGCREVAMGILSLDDLVEGDILLLDNHTCIFLYINGDKIHTLDGNSGDKVCERDRSINTIHGVCKPNFEQTETIVISENNGIKYATDRYGNLMHGFFSYHENSYYAQEDGTLLCNAFTPDGKRYALSDGSFVIGKFSVNGKSYITDDKGFLYDSEKFVKYDEKYFFIKEDGSLACNEFIKDGWYYASSDCYLQTGEFLVNDKQYIADEKGRLYAKNSKFKYNENYYYAAEDGSLAKNKFVSDTWYATSNYTLLTESSIIIENKKYFFNEEAELEGTYKINKGKSIVKYDIKANDEYNVFNSENITIPKKISVRKGTMLNVCNADIDLIVYNGYKNIENKIKINENTKLKILIEMNGKMKTYKVKINVRK